MKKAILLSLLFAPILFSCKKSSSGSGYHVTASVDGTSKAFNTAVVAIKTTQSGISIVQITGIVSVTTQEAMNISIGSSTKTIGVGTYTDTDPNFDVEIDYSPNTTDDFLGGSLTADDALGNSVTINHTKLVITSMDATSIKGTFSGDFYQNGDVPGTKKTITSGDFYAKFQ